VEDIHRGDVVTWPGLYRPTQRLDVRFRLLADVTGPLRHASQVKLFLGTSETIADVRLLGQEILEPGQEGWLQLELHQPAVTVRGDRYILRRPSPGETLGGGVVLDAQPQSRSKRFDKQVLARLESLTRGSPAELLLQASLALGPAEIPQVIRRARLEIPDVGEALGQLITSGSLVLLEEGEWSPTSALLVMAREAWAALKDRTLQIIKDSHRDSPLRSGMPREELKSRLKLSPRVFNALVKKLAAEQVLVEKGNLVSLPGQEIRYSPEQQRAIDALLTKFEAVPYSPPGVKECQSEIGEGLYNSLIETGQLVPVSTEVVFKKTTYDQMVEKIRQVLTQKQTLTLAEVRDLFNTSRRYVQALLEHMDAVGVTVRDGDFRRLHK
jgi:selenocysteine-specific elongation factor